MRNIGDTKDPVQYHYVTRKQLDENYVNIIIDNVRC